MDNNKYSKGKIYKIVDVGYNKCYIGSTCEGMLCKRMAKHRISYNQFKKNNYSYNTVFDIFDEYGLENCKIELVEDFPCNNKRELLKREGFHIQGTECVNKYIAGIGHKLSSKLFYERNRAKMLANGKKYREENKEKEQARHKTYNDNNKDKIQEYHKQYRIINKDKLQESHLCEICGGKFTIGHKASHSKSAKHQAVLKYFELKSNS